MRTFIFIQDPFLNEIPTLKLILIMESEFLDLNTFKTKTILDTNVTQQKIIILGQFQGKQGQAILILAARVPDPFKIHFENVQVGFLNDIYGRFDATISTKFQIQTIFPITQKHKDKYRKVDTLIVRETKQMYEENKQKLLEKQLQHVDWVQNILDGKAEQQRILFRKENQYVILPDFKFVDLKDIDNLHLLAILNDPLLNSIRDLRAKHIPFLEQIKDKIQQLLKSIFKIKGSCRMYFHYPPTFYRMHIHVVNIKLCGATSTVERCHELNSVIENIRLKDNYYQEITLNTFVKVAQQEN